jgi:DNA topoisomerase-1
LLHELRHNGVVAPEPAPALGLHIVARGQTILLTPRQEEMALAWARKKGTPYVQDEVFAANFMRDFSAELGIEPPLALDEVDLAACFAAVDAERAAKEALTPEQRKALSLERRMLREALQAQYGYAIVNGQRVELGAYMVEPSGIFMGRGQHPLRGRWKEGARQSDITLNMGPDASDIKGDWAEIVWQPESLWVARWQDKLGDKLKYIWLSDTAPVKQAREAQKFDKAIQLDAHIARVRQEIERALSDADARRRTIATVCHLIDVLCLRVGDEKEADEADTVGATTLRPEHVTLHGDDSAEFHFLGKDSVEWHKTIALPAQVLANLRGLIAQVCPSDTAGNRGNGGNRGNRDLPQLFPDVNSAHVNGFLSSIMPGLSAKVFRTHHATSAVGESLAASEIKPTDPEYRKWEAASRANLQAAVLCNHTKQWRGDPEAIAQRHQERRAKADERLTRARQQEKECRAALRALRKEAKERAAAGAAAAPDAAAFHAAAADAAAFHAAAADATAFHAAAADATAFHAAAADATAFHAAAADATAFHAAAPDLAGRRAIAARYRRRVEPAKVRLAAAQERRSRAEAALGKIDAQYAIAEQKRTWNLGTSLKSYIDPRVYYRWGRQVDYDVLERYYPTTLRRKYAWVRTVDRDEQQPAPDASVRACMSSDLAAVGELFRMANTAYAGAALPVAVEEIAARYMPALEGDWREAVIALGPEQQAIALVVLGPLWEEGDAAYLDLFAVMRPGEDDPELAERLALEMNRRVESYALHHRKTNTQLRPRDVTWFHYAPALAASLELAGAGAE